MGILRKATGAAAGFIRETAASGAGHVAIKTFEGIGEGAKERAKKLMEENRPELRGLLHRLWTEGRLCGNIQRRLNLREAEAPRTYGNHEPYLPGDEDRAWDALAEFKAAHQEPDEQPILEEYLVYLDHLGEDQARPKDRIAEGDRQFDEEIERLRREKLWQSVRRVWALMKRRLPRAAAVKKTSRKATHATDDLAADFFRAADKWMRKHL